MAVVKRKLNVLIIDDNETTRAVLRMIIQGDHFDVVGDAASGNAGLDRMRRLKPDIVCLDVSMPDADGLDILQAIKNESKGTMVLMVTASNDVKTVQTAIARGANGFIIKPFNSGTVLDTLESTAAKLRELKP
jgi:two-component system chemotaxis response regulator CheY